MPETKKKTVKVRRAHTDSQGRRWQIGDEVDEHPDRKSCPWLFDDYRPRKAKGE